MLALHGENGKKRIAVETQNISGQRLITVSVWDLDGHAKTKLSPTAARMLGAALMEVGQE